MIPTGSRLQPLLAQDPRGALVDHAPSPGRLRVAQPQLEARRALLVGREARADPLARRGRSSVPGAVPSQITTGIPAALAISAAATLLRMPPSPKGEVRSPIS